ncbi:MAG: LL-diaminopimelate aminotransferase [Chlamydiae bacterium]|nr:LL-diaminopimelate aminotransferase [Chlamydiota bacterium]
MLNPNFEKLSSEYIFPIIERKLAKARQERPGEEVINLGVGDICLPLAPSIAKAISDGVLDMEKRSRGYGPAEGYPFLRELIAENEYSSFGIGADEIFLSDGTNSDASNIQDLFASGCCVAIPNPTYPVYRDASIIAGNEVIYLPCNLDSGFVPQPPKEKVDFVYLCTPNNPTGVAMTRPQLEKWVRWAQETKTFLIVDAVYSSFITSSDVPPSIYAIEGAKEVAIELKSFSKSAGFTGLRCGYAVLPKALLGGKLHALWQRRADAKSNGVSYPIQYGAAATFTPEGRKETRAQVTLYQEGGRILREGLKALGFEFFGGVDCPYIWWKNPVGYTSWEFFDKLLSECLILAIPGSGFGSEGEGYMRLSCFTTRAIAQETITRLGTIRCAI